jgi:WD40 repeat protein
LKIGITGHSAQVNSVAISFDGATIVSGSKDKTIKIWDLATGKLLHTLTGHSDEVNSIAISSDGKTIVSGSRDKTIKIWDITTGKLLHTLTGDSNEVVLVAISLNNKTIFSVSVDRLFRDKIIKICDLDTGQLQRTTTYSNIFNNVNVVAISPDGKLILGGTSGKIITGRISEDTIKIGSSVCVMQGAGL